MKRINLGIIGAGNIASEHLKVIKKIKCRTKKSLNEIKYYNHVE